MAGLNFNASPAIRRTQGRVEAFSQKNLNKVRSRAISSTTRALKAETSRAVSELQLNLSPSQISPFIAVKSTSEYIGVSAAAKRLALSAFRPSFSDTGASATTWRDLPAYVIRHGFSRGDGQVWQRAPGGSSPSGLVSRLPILVRKGPSLKRALEDTGRGGSHNRDKVVERLALFTKEKLADEIQRLISSLARS